MSLKKNNKELLKTRPSYHYSDDEEEYSDEEDEYLPSKRFKNGESSDSKMSRKEERYGYIGHKLQQMPLPARVKD